MRIARVVLFTIVLVIGGTTSPALAAMGPDCGWYDYQSDAQADFDAAPEFSPNLDQDGNGIACDELPGRPTLVEDAYRIRGQFDDSFATVGIRGSTYGSWFHVEFAGMALASQIGAAPNGVVCPDLVSAETIESLLALPDGSARQYYLLSATDNSLPPDGSEEVTELQARVFTVLGDPTNPVELNYWFIANGIGVFTESPNMSAEAVLTLQSAQEQAQAQGLGVWGACEIPVELSAEAASGTSHDVPDFQNGDQVVTFDIDTPGVYRIELIAQSGDAVFVALDIYTIEGEWLPSLGISTAEAGTFTSAGYLETGRYYYQVNAVGSWSVSIDPLE